MQDIHSIGGGRFFAAGGGGGDRRLRPHHHPNQQVAALKCPRCDSLNTKFCYYNNYNLSQPRHFCKSCRRYWTKGGVLRNVPVGGGCRKTKRSKPKASCSTTSTPANTTPPPPPPPPQPQPSQDRKSNSHSSSESSSLTAATNTTATATVTEVVSAPSTSSASNLMKINQESKFFVSQSSSNPSFEVAPPSAPASLLEQGGSDCGIFTEIESFTSLIASSVTGAMPSFEYGSISDVSISPFRLSQNHHHHHHQNQNQVQQSQSWQEQSQKVTLSVGDDQELKMQDLTGGLLQTAQVDLSVLHDSRSNGGGFGSLGDWQECGDQGPFDLTNAVDQAYWSQGQWTDQDHPSLYLP